jgi:hypothetical protein
MTNIKHQTVNICIKNGLNGYRQLHDTQIGRKMPTGLRNTGHQKIADLTAQKGLLFRCETLQITMAADFL